VQGNLESVRLLVEAGANINPQDKDGDFPLSLAAGTHSLSLTHHRHHHHQSDDVVRPGYDHTDVISYLLEKGASVNCQSTKDGESGIFPQ
jgi:ankyrin repeat protein